MAKKAASEAATLSNLKYAERLAQSKEQKDDRERALNVEDAKSDVESRINQQKREIMKAERVLEEAKSVFPLDVDAILNASDELAALEGGLQDLEGLHEELF